jgi:hypothetical protein
MDKLLFLFLLVIALTTGCARIPAESVQLNNAIMMEGERMHNLNISLVNELFAEKQRAVSEFIERDYIPAIVKNFTGLVNPEDINAENLPDILLAIIPEITSRRDGMIQTLEEQRLKLVTKMNADYQVYYDASVTINNLLQSAVEVDKERAAFNDRIKQLSGQKIDLNKVEMSVDAFISKAGISGSIEAAIADLDNAISEIINQQK